MRKGTARTVGCLETVILDQVDILFDEGGLSRQQAQDWLNLLQLGVQKLYWAIYNENRACFCGTMYTLFHLARNADILEHMIEVIIDQRTQYRLHEPRIRKNGKSQRK